MGRFWKSYKNRKHSIRIAGERNSLYVELNSFEINTGENSNQISFVVPMDKQFTETYPPFHAGTYRTQGEVISLTFYDARNAPAAVHYFKIISMTTITRGDRKAFSYVAKDYFRHWAKDQHVWKRYNDINDRDYYDRTKAKYGFYWTTSQGIVQFKQGDPNSKDLSSRLGMIDAYHALIDVFYSPKREILTKSGNGNDYPQLLFDPFVLENLKKVILPTKNYQQTNMLSAIMDILREVNSRYTIYCYGVGKRLRDQVMLVTEIGRGPQIKGVTNTNPRTTLEDYAMLNHGPKSGKAVILRDQSTINTENQIDAIKYKGAKRQYFVRHAWLLPAWDWWNDYTLVVRNKNTKQIISPQITTETGSLIDNPEYPLFMRTVINSPTYSLLKDFSHVFEYNSPTDPKGRFRIYDAISRVMHVLMYEIQIAAGLTDISPTSSDADVPQEDKIYEDVDQYLVNLVALDYLIFKNDPIHKYRFKRFIAVPAGRTDLINIYTPTNGWDYPDLQRFKNISDRLVDGKRTDIHLRYLSSNLDKSDTYQLSVPPVCESERPNFLDPGANFGSDSTTSGTTTGGLPLEWHQIEMSQIQGEEGFFWVSDPFASSLYWDNATVVAAGSGSGDISIGMENLGYDYYRGDTAVGNQPTNPNDDPRLEYFTVMAMKAGGISGVQFERKGLPFRARMRSTFYYTKEETLKSKFFGGSTDPSAPNWYFDQIFPQPEYNDPWLAGIVTPQDIGVSDKSIDLRSGLTRYGYFEDNSMVWQSAHDINDPSARLSVGHDGSRDYWVTIGEPNNPNYKGILMSQILNREDLNVLGKRLYLNLQWPHRDDRELLKQKAKLKLMERINPQFGGMIETYEMVELGTPQFLSGTKGVGLGSLVYKGYNMPITGYTVSFPNLTSNLQFEINIPMFGRGFEFNRITSLRAQESIRDLIPKQEEKPKTDILDTSKSSPSESATVNKGFNDPHKSNKPDFFDMVSGSSFGKMIKNLPSSDANNAQKVVESMVQSVLPLDGIRRVAKMAQALRKYPEMRDSKPQTDSRAKE